MERSYAYAQQLGGRDEGIPTLIDSASLTLTEGARSFLLPRRQAWWTMNTAITRVDPELPVNDALFA
jgi:hypothetical protein